VCLICSLFDLKTGDATHNSHPRTHQTLEQLHPFPYTYLHFPHIKVAMDHVHFAHSPVHGIGVFASEDIEPGTKIMEEIALWVIDKLTFLRGTFPTSLDAKDLHIMRGIMIESFKRSNPFEEGSVQKKEYEGKILGLYGRPVQGDEMSGDPAELQKVLSMRVREIIIQNAVHEPGDGQPEWNAVFEGASRVNHSCVPNAELVLAEGAGGSRVCYSINVITHLPDYVTDRYQWSTITTTTSIKKGEEIFLNYLDPLTLSAARQKKLKSRWGFTCACKLCVSPQREVAASDERHAAIATTLKLIMACEATQSGGFVVGDLGWKRVDALAQEEGVNDMTLFKV
jgi:hypothetical protein